VPTVRDSFLPSFALVRRLCNNARCHIDSSSRNGLSMVTFVRSTSNKGHCHPFIAIMVISNAIPPKFDANHVLKRINGGMIDPKCSVRSGQDM
jgi:hypothetical protein